MYAWSLAIDFGTSFTTAAVADGDRAEVLEIDHSRYLPSVVCLDEDGNLVVGRAAVSEAAAFPERAERVPKRALVAGDQVRLAGRTFPTTELVAAVLRRVGDEALRRHDGDAPRRVVLTHPARWGDRELSLLATAARAAGLRRPEFVAEPLAAARHYLAVGDVPAGACVAVYDLGGGTFDTAVLRRTEDGFALTGPPGGDDAFGGEDLDTVLRAVVAGYATAADAQTWELIWTGDDRASARRRAQWRRALTEAKEALSTRTSVSVYQDGFEEGIRVTRTEYEAATEARLRASVAELGATVQRAGLAVDELAAVYLTGSASRTPQISDLVHEMLGVLPRTTGDPKTAVVLGALARPAQPEQAAPPAADTGLPTELGPAIGVGAAGAAAPEAADDRPFDATMVDDMPPVPPGSRPSGPAPASAWDGATGTGTGPSAYRPSPQGTGPDRPSAAAAAAATGFRQPDVPAPDVWSGAAATSATATGGPRAAAAPPPPRPPTFTDSWYHAPPPAREATGWATRPGGVPPGPDTGTGPAAAPAGRPGPSGERAPRPREGRRGRSPRALLAAGGVVLAVAVGAGILLATRHSPATPAASGTGDSPEAAASSGPHPSATSAATVPGAVQGRWSGYLRTAGGSTVWVAVSLTSTSGSIEYNTPSQAAAATLEPNPTPAWTDTPTWSPTATPTWTWTPTMTPTWATSRGSGGHGGGTSSSSCIGRLQLSSASASAAVFTQTASGNGTACTPGLTVTLTAQTGSSGAHQLAYAATGTTSGGTPVRLTGTLEGD